MVRTGFEPATYGFQIRRSNHSATLPHAATRRKTVADLKNVLTSSRKLLSPDYFSMVICRPRAQSVQFLSKSDGQGVYETRRFIPNRIGASHGRGTHDFLRLTHLFPVSSITASLHPCLCISTCLTPRVKAGCQQY